MEHWFSDDLRRIELNYFAQIRSILETKFGDKIWRQICKQFRSYFWIYSNLLKKYYKKVQFCKYIYFVLPNNEISIRIFSF